MNKVKSGKSNKANKLKKLFIRKTVRVANLSLINVDFQKSFSIQHLGRHRRLSKQTTKSSVEHQDLVWKKEN